MKKDVKYIIIFIVAIIAYSFFEWIQPKPIDWSPSYSNKDKIPLGNLILYSELKSIFPEKKIHTVFTSIYENTDTITPTYIEQGDHLRKGKYNYIIITNQFNPGDTDINSLLEFIHTGNNAFIATEEFPEFLKDSLNFELSDYYLDQLISTDTSLADSTYLSFTSSVLSGNYYYPRVRVPVYFSSIDTSSAIVLGLNEDKKPTLIKIRHGDGNIFLSSTPVAFSNINMLKDDNAMYVSSALSYLPNSDVLWDEYFKMNRVLRTSPLRVILNYEPLRWSYYIAIFSIVLFILFEAKRRQRIIPVIKPLPNTTLEFVRTIGFLYYQQRNHKDIATKKIIYFLDYIRTNYFLKTNHLDLPFIKKLALKSGKPLDEVKHLISLIEKINKKNSISEQELLRLNRDLEKFYH